MDGNCWAELAALGENNAYLASYKLSSCGCPSSGVLVGVYLFWPIACSGPSWCFRGRRAARRASPRAAFFVAFG